MATIDPTETQLKNRELANQGLPVIDSNTLNSNQDNLNVSTYTEPPIPPVPTIEMTQPEKELSSAQKEIMRLREQGLGESARRSELEQQAGIGETQKTISDLQARLKSLTAESQTIPLQVQEEARGQGATIGGLRPIQASALRKNAIQTLTTQAQLAGAQGNLTTALSLVDRAVKAEFDPIKEELAVKEANLQTLLESPELSVAEKNRATQQQAKIDAQKREVEKQEADKKAISEFTIKALQSGADSITAGKIGNAKTPLEAAIIASEAGLFLPETEKLDTDVVKLDNGNTVLINTQSGEVIKNYGGAKPTIDEIAEADKKLKDLTVVNDINIILNDPAFDETFGALNAVNRINPYSASYAVAANVNNLKQNLALAARGQLKGQGTISDFEGKMLAEAQTALKINMTPDEARKQLVKVRGAIRTSSGLDAMVKITDPETGEFRILSSNSEDITNAIEDGAVVEYYDPILEVKKEEK